MAGDAAVWSDGPGVEKYVERAEIIKIQIEMRFWSVEFGRLAGNAATRWIRYNETTLVKFSLEGTRTEKSAPSKGLRETGSTDSYRMERWRPYRQSLYR